MSPFKHVETLHELQTKGIARINLCAERTVDQLTDVFRSLHPDWNDTMRSQYYFSIYGWGRDYRKAIYDQMLPILTPDLDSLFSDYQILAVIAQVKGVGENSSVGIHQDLTIVDESRHRAYTLWLPLQDSTEENGPLSFLEYSQHVFRSIRAHTIGYQFGDVEDYILANAKQYLTTKGEALIFDSATIHYSVPNLSNAPRISLGISLVEKGVNTEIYHFDKSKPFDGKLDRYEVPSDFWYRYDEFDKERLLPPKFGNKTGTKEAQIQPYERESFIANYERELQRHVKP